MCPYRRLISCFPSAAPFIRECEQNALVTLSSWCLLCSARLCSDLPHSLYLSRSLFLPPSCFGVGYNLKAPYMPARRLVALAANRKHSSRLSFRRMGSMQETQNAIVPLSLFLPPSHPPSLSFTSSSSDWSWQSGQLTYPASMPLSFTRQPAPSRP